MNLLVRGAGSIGTRHIKNALALGHTVFVTDPDESAVERAIGAGAQWHGNAMPVNGRSTWGAVIDATPPSQRSPGILPTLFEKPLAADVAYARQVARCANPLSIVGYQLRFVPRLNELKAEVENQPISYARIRFSQHLKDWRPNTDWRNGVSAHLGILLEASHELDLLCWLMGPWSWVQGWTSKTLGLPTEDVAVALVGLTDGGVVELHLDMVREGYDRGIEVVGHKTHIVNLGLLSYGSERDKNKPYMDELATFIAGVDAHSLGVGFQGPGTPATLEDGLRAVELADAIKLSSATGQRVFNGAEVEGLATFIGRNWS